MSNDPHPVDHVTSSVEPATTPAPVPDWLVTEVAEEEVLGTLRSGKEAQVDLVRRHGFDGTTCVLARKRYLPRSVSSKGELEALGVQRASAFRHDVEYREGRQFRKSRDRRAIERMSTHGKSLLQQRWLNHEFDVTRELHAAGCVVPYPVEFVDNCFFMEYVGSLEEAAPQLFRARLTGDELASAWEQLVDGLATMTAAGWVHGDLSAYNLLWWEGRLWFIDLPQAVDLAANPGGLDFLHRDVTNVTTWFARRGLDVDAEETFADLLAHAFS